MVVEARPELVSKLVREAAALPAAERAAFLDRACAGDSKLRREVEARLAPPSPEGPTLTEAEPDAGAESTVTMDLSRHRIGPYLVTEQIGEGGMGVVYRAHDTQLDRSVAIKVLPPGVRADSERRWRFLNEAKAASALNHPNIVTIYTITQHQGMDCIVMEYLEGKPLSKLIPRKGLPVKEALRIGAEVADALAAAHAAGIVHRDLKPSNVMVSEKGRVKVLDFGLAKLRQRGVAADGEPHTEAGRVFGTVGYMSPEQAEGKEVDARSDIFSFGCVLYEMLSGHRPFKGTSTASVIAALLTTDPEPPAGVPDDLKHVLCRCFRKDPARRWQSIADVKIALEDVQTGLACAPAAPSRFRRLRRAAPVVLAAAALVAAAYTTWKHWALQGGKLEYSVAQVTEEPGQEQNPALSPDGRTLVYASQGSGNWDLYSLRVGGRNPINLTKDSPADDTQPAFSWDGERIAFRSEREGGGIFIMGATGESVRRLTDFGYLPAWSPDGKQIACSTAGPYRPDVREVISSQVFAVDVDTGQRRLLSGGVLDAVQPNWSPHGTRVAFWGMREGARDIFTVSREGGAVTMVTSDEALDWNPVWSPDGKYLYFSSNRGGAMNLWRVPIREETGKTRGDPEPVTVPATYAAGISFSRDGQRLAYMNCLRRTNLFRAGFDPARESVTGAPSALTKSLQEALYPSISRDGQWVAFTHQGLQEDLLAVKADGSAVRQITGDPAQDRMPRWSPDSRELAYMSTRSGRFEIWTVHADGSGLRQITEGSPRGGVSSPAWSPDGKRLSYNLPDEMGYIIEAGKPWREQQPQLAKAELPDRSWFWVSDWSHDGERLAGTIQRFDGSALGVAVYTIKTGRIEQVTGFGRLPRWLPDGRRLLFHANGRIFLVDTAGKRTREILSVPEGYISPYFDLSWDGRMIAFSLETLESDIWILSPNR